MTILDVHTTGGGSVRAGTGYWTRPYGEPEWIIIPTDEHQPRETRRDAFLIARVPITNAQYYLFVQAIGYRQPRHWGDGRPPRGLESHPVVYVSWHDAVAYCEWLSDVTGKKIALPTDEEWTRAARGDDADRVYPWGGTFDRLKCNTSELGVGGTTPVGIFPDGASTYGVLDMSGNVWEWTRTFYDDDEDSYRLRGGSFVDLQSSARVASVSRNNPVNSNYYLGFRVCAPSF